MDAEEEEKRKCKIKKQRRINQKEKGGQSALRRDNFSAENTIQHFVFQIVTFDSRLASFSSFLHQ